MSFDFMHFIRPLWLLLLPLVILLPWAWKRTRQPAGDWARVCDPHLLRWLSVEQSNGEGRGGGHWLAGLALLVVILALSGPSWQKLPDVSYSARDARVILIDLSRSMLAEDLRPNRLTRARFRLADLLENTEEGQVGLIAFAGDAYVVSPLTNDMNTIANLLPALRPDIIPVAGSRADLALDMAAALLRRSGMARGEILLVTDAANSRDAAKARELRDDGVITSVLAVGTDEGAPIPSGGGFVSDRGGNVVISRMQRRPLKAVADAGGGVYTELGTALQESLLWGAVDGSEFTRRDDALGERWKDAGPWLVLLLIPLVLTGFRRGLLFLLPLLLVNGMALPRDAQAGWWEDLWQRKDEQAYRALHGGDPQKAAALAVDPNLSGEAWYRSGEYANALEAWSALDTGDAHYNRGNALAQAGELDAAIKAYDRALELQPDMLDAIYNRNIVEQLKQQQEQEQQGDQGESGESEQSEEQQDGEQSEDQQEGESGEENESSDESQSEQQDESEGDGTEQQVDYSEAWSEEDAQAMEQWLRRIPDDPGGLLRRKFRNQHQRRGAPEDQSETW
ncbi:MAG: VWA domain-containing protein [Xanthomonadales bacterium]|jgi:Ca-activated chloride channel family protein|nr:VWA domain-containing protein [Xanthomonadales bacterium]